MSLTLPPVLVVDDFASMRRVVSAVLKQIGFTEIHEAENGQIALSILRSRQIGFVISDWNMPVMDGLALLRAIRGIEKVQNIPVLMLTAEGMRDNVIEAGRAGATAYILKPFTPAKLTSVVQKIFGIEAELKAA